MSHIDQEPVSRHGGVASSDPSVRCLRPRTAIPRREMRSAGEDRAPSHPRIDRSGLEMRFPSENGAPSHPRINRSSLEMPSLARNEPTLASEDRSLESRGAFRESEDRDPESRDVFREREGRSLAFEDPCLESRGAFREREGRSLAFEDRCLESPVAFREREDRYPESRDAFKRRIYGRDAKNPETCSTTYAC